MWAAFGIALAIGAVTFLIWWVTSPPAQEGPRPVPSNIVQAGPPRGGLIAGLSRFPPVSFNRYVADGDVHEAIALLTQEKLVRINGSTDQIEPRLAESWTRSDDNLTYTITLRPGLLWSDGNAFTAADVVFSLRAVYDRQSPSSLGSLLRVHGKPLSVRAIDPSTVELTFPAPFAPGLRLLDPLPILPRHKLEQALNDGTFRAAWGPKPAPADIVGMGPFVFSEYRPAQRRDHQGDAVGVLMFSRNPRYWRKAPDGAPRPYLDRVQLAFFPEHADLINWLSAGDADFDVGSRYSGLAADALWFNLSAVRTTKPWLADESFRHAISATIDRREYCQITGCAPVAGPVTSVNASWFNPDLPSGRHDPQLARTMLAQLGLQDRNHDGILDDAAGRPARFTLLLRDSAVMADESTFLWRSLKGVGIDVTIVELDEDALRGRWRTGDYEAIIDRIDMRDTDPAMNLDFWLSSGSRHLWNPNQAKPATDWEGRIDELMLKHAATFDRVDRVQLFAEVQRIFAEHLPAIYLGAPKLDLATPPRLLNATRSVIRPNLLRNADSVAVLPR